jgi:hypothetical protein
MIDDPARTESLRKTVSAWAEEQYDDDMEQMAYLLEWHRTHRVVPLWLSLGRFAVVLTVIAASVGAIVWWWP